jgi:hypothetical protein
MVTQIQGVQKHLNIGKSVIDLQETHPILENNKNARQAFRQES